MASPRTTTRIARQFTGLIRPPRKQLYHVPGTQPPSPNPPPQIAILRAAATHIPTHGFTTQALSLGLVDAGYPPASANLFPRGPFDLVMHHLTTQRQALAHSRSAQPLAAAADGPASPAGSATLVREALRALIVERLQANAPIQSHLTGMLALMSLAGNIPASLRELGLLADELVYLSGDVRVDGGWYARRGAVAGVYASAEVFMSQDRSVGFVETEGFVDRRLEGMERAGYVVGSVGEWVGGSAIGAVNVARSLGLRI